MMKLKHLESALQDVSEFDDPNIELEQYQTSAHLAARMIHTMAGYGDITGRQVLDLGCGCGMLSIASALMGCSYVVGVDLDSHALDRAKENVEEFELDSNIDLIQANVNGLQLKLFDTVVMNPPFGTRCKGIDMAFVKAGIDHALTAVYSLHKTSTRQHIQKKSLEWGVKMTVVATMRFDLPQTYCFHKSASKDIDVDFIRFAKIQR
uniref:Methyltransferase small domain-containing protein n=1 Tax=Spongospora subterranea TaxID=70186 RepID=A0A0H5QLC6_9EUKA|eukprot:CRZ02161.1 hypothetical protein [Spongospora subterranea]